MTRASGFFRSVREGWLSRRQMLSHVAAGAFGLG